MSFLLIFAGCMGFLFSFIGIPCCSTVHVMRVSCRRWQQTGACGYLTDFGGPSYYFWGHDVLLLYLYLDHLIGLSLGPFCSIFQHSHDFRSLQTVWSYQGTYGYTYRSCERRMTSHQHGVKLGDRRIEIERRVEAGAGHHHGRRHVTRYTPKAGQSWTRMIIVEEQSY